MTQLKEPIGRRHRTYKNDSVTPCRVWRVNRAMHVAGQTRAVQNAIRAHSGFHQRHVHDKVGGKHECAECGKKFNKLRQLSEHQRVHTGERPSSCELCAYNCNSLAGLNSHIKRIHTDERPYCCKDCGKRFLEEGVLKKHQLRVHDKVRPFSCSVCSKSFFSSKSFHKHEMRHAGIHPYPCTQCSKSFLTDQHRQQHELRHRSDRINASSARKRSTADQS